jgi:hypothetical protein
MRDFDRYSKRIYIDIVGIIPGFPECYMSRFSARDPANQFSKIQVLSVEDGVLRGLIWPFRGCQRGALGLSGGRFVISLLRDLRGFPFFVSFVLKIPSIRQALAGHMHDLRGRAWATRCGSRRCGRPGTVCRPGWRGTVGVDNHPLDGPVGGQGFADFDRLGCRGGREPERGA